MILVLTRGGVNERRQPCNLTEAIDYFRDIMVIRVRNIDGFNEGLGRKMKRGREKQKVRKKNIRVFHVTFVDFLFLFKMPHS